MDLNSVKSHQQKQKQKEPNAVVEPQNDEYKYNHCITLQFNTLLYIKLQNMVENAYTAGDFTYVSIVDVIRSALDAYEAGMQLTELDQPGDRRNISIRLTENQHQFYKSLPNRLRRRLLERAVRSFLKDIS